MVALGAALVYKAFSETARSITTGGGRVRLARAKDEGLA